MVVYRSHMAYENIKWYRHYTLHILIFFIYIFCVWIQGVSSRVECGWDRHICKYYALLTWLSGSFCWKIYYLWILYEYNRIRMTSQIGSWCNVIDIRNAFVPIKFEYEFLLILKFYSAIAMRGRKSVRCLQITEELTKVMLICMYLHEYQIQFSQISGP